MSRLVVISNRVQAPTAGSGNQGGLAVALAAALREDDGLWFGWSGDTTDDFSGTITERDVDGVRTATIDLEDQDVEEYYNGFANRTLWPLFHYRIDLAVFERDFAAGYYRVNRRFADTVAPQIAPDDLVWVHDYHLIPLGQELRARGLANRIGFFLHIPWPPMRLLIAMPEHRALVEALFAYDVIGFQTDEWLDSFRHYAVQQMGATLGPDDRITVGDRTIRAIACPIGIDAREFAGLAETESARFARDRMWMSATGRSLIVGVDRLDYSKGLEERFLGYERFLKDYPDFQALVSLLQIAPPSRETVDTYRKIRGTLDALSGRINGEYADIDWVPIRYVNRGFPRDQLAGIYRAARVGLVTPMHDGMNLVAKEYVAAQDPDDPGVLILSQFAGAAQQMRDAVLVNPFSPEDIADALHTALTMKLEERQARWRALMTAVEREDVLWWRTRFTDALVGEERGEMAAPRPEPEPEPASSHA